MWYVFLLALSACSNCWAMAPLESFDLSQKTLLVENKVGKLYGDKNNPGVFDLIIFEEGKTLHRIMRPFSEVDTSSFGDFTLNRIEQDVYVCVVAKTKGDMRNAYRWCFKKSSDINVTSCLACDLPNNVACIKTLSQILCAAYTQQSDGAKLAGFISVPSMTYRQISPHFDTSCLPRSLAAKLLAGKK